MSRRAGALTAGTRSGECGNSRRYALTAAVAGFCSLVVQVSFVREILVSLKGNEIHAGVILCAWLAAGALGSCLAPLLLRRVRGGTLAAVSAGLSALAAPAFFLFIRYMRALFPLHAYVPGPGEASLLAVTAVAPVSFLLGLLLGTVMSRGGEKGPATSYMFETFGILAGGLFFTFAVTLYAGITHGIFFAAFLLAAVAAAWAGKGRRAITGLLLGTTAAVYAAGVAGGGADAVEYRSRAARYMKGERLSAARSLTTPYGDVDVTVRNGQVNVYHNGAHVGGSGAEAGSEETGGMVNLVRPGGGDMLVVGATVSRIPREILRWGRWRIDLLEPDPGMAEMRHVAGASPVVLVREDPVAYPARTRKKYDAVTMRIVLPATLVLNRLYTMEYFASLKRVLSPGGVLCLAADVPPRFAPPSYRRMAGSIFTAAAAAFRRSRVLVMDHVMLWVYSDGTLPSGGECLDLFLRRMGDARWMSPHTVEKAFRGEETRSWEKILRRSAAGPNTVTRPRAVDNYLRYWSAVHGARLPFSLPRPAAAAGGGILLLACVTAFFLLNRRGTAGARIAWTTFLAGGAGMGFEMLLVYLFQMRYGSLFSAMGLLFACFMAGSGAGALHGRLLRSPGPRRAAAAFAGILLLCLVPAAAYRAATAFAWTPFLLNAMAGYGVGLAFAVFSRLFCARRPRGGGIVYGADLAGGCASGILTGLYFIPRAGIACTGALLACACAAGLLLCLAGPPGRSTR